MRCRDCMNFRCEAGSNLECSKEISPGSGVTKGKCTLDNRSCNMDDNCGCGGFRKK